MLQFSIRVLSLLTIGIVASSCGAPAPPDATSLRGPITLTALAGSRSSASVGRALFRSPKRRNTSSSTIVYVSDPYANEVVQCMEPYCSLCKPIGTEVVEPEGMVTGSLRTEHTSSTYLYVAAAGASEVLVVKPAGSACPVINILQDSGYIPADVAVRRDGLVAATNLCTAPYCYSPGNIEFYKPGATVPTYTATGLLSRFYFGDFDKAGNFYNDGLNGSGEAAVGVVPVGSTTDISTGITGISFPGGIQVARNRTINVLDQDCPCIQIYKPTATGFAHVGTVALTGVSDPVTFALDKKNRYLWVTDAGTGAVDQFRYPAGGRIVQSFTGFEQPIGVALIPPDNP